MNVFRAQADKLAELSNTKIGSRLKRQAYVDRLVGFVICAGTAIILRPYK